MKKLFYVVVLAATVVLTGCGKKGSVNSLPDELRTFIEQTDDSIKIAIEEAKQSGELSELAQYGIEFNYDGVSVEDKNIVFTLKFGGDMMKALSLKDLLKAQGLDEAAFQQALRQGEFKDMFNADEKELVELLCKYEYNIGIRLKGEQKDDEVTFVLTYEDLDRMK